MPYSKTLKYTEKNKPIYAIFLRIFAENISGGKKFIFKLCGITESDLEPEKAESKTRDPEREAAELASFLKEDQSTKRYSF